MLHQWIFSFHVRFPAAALLIKFIQYFESFVVMPTIFIASSLSIDLSQEAAFIVYP